MAQLVVSPMMGGGVFSGGNVPMIAGSLIGHLVYGGLVGGLFAAGNEVREPARAQFRVGARARCRAASLRASRPSEGEAVAARESLRLVGSTWGSEPPTAAATTAAPRRSAPAEPRTAGAARR